MSFPDGDKLHLSIDGTRPYLNSFEGLWVHYKFTHYQDLRLMRSRKTMEEWVAEATANGEVVERISWPPQENPPRT